MPQPTSKAPKNRVSEIDRKALAAKTRRIKVAPATKTPSYTGDEARKAQDKQSKKYYKNPKNTTSSSRYT